MTEVNNKHLIEMFMNMYPSQEPGPDIESNDNLQFPPNPGPYPGNRERYQKSGTSQFSTGSGTRITSGQELFKFPTNNMSQRVLSNSYQHINSGSGTVSENKQKFNKWIFSFIFSFVSVFVFSEFFMTNLDDFFMNKNISIFDINGKPKLFLIASIFLFLVLFFQFMLLFL